MTEMRRCKHDFRVVTRKRHIIFVCGLTLEECDYDCPSTCPNYGDIGERKQKKQLIKDLTDEVVELLSDTDLALCEIDEETWKAIIRRIRVIGDICPELFPDAYHTEE